MKRILVADDNPVSRELIREILEADDYEVIEAGDGQEALDKLREYSPDLALLDIQMPILDGMALIRELRAEGSNLPIIMISNSPNAKEEGSAAGANRFMEKGEAMSHLSEAVRILLSARPVTRAV